MPPQQQAGAAYPPPGSGSPYTPDIPPHDFVYGAATQPPGPNRLGLISFLLGLVYWLGNCVIVGIVTAPLFKEAAKGKQPAPEEIERMLENQPAWAMTASVVLMVAAVAGLALGLIALNRKGARKGLAIAGAVMCGLACLCLAGNMVGALLG
jgi:hypothetical protein